MSEDPRIAALAEALMTTFGHGWLRSTPPDPVREWLMNAEALLAALPPDWCGHQPDTDEDWRRLRKIEEAARDLASHEIIPPSKALDALRAALKADGSLP